MSDAADWAADKLGHRFAESAWLTQALTHKSHGEPDYERLEFLGDRVLGCVIAAWLVEASPQDEGALARRFATLVERDSCAEIARAAGVPDHIRMDKATQASGVHHSVNALADVIEALIGAVHVDGGYAAAEAMVRRLWAARFAGGEAALKDPKSRLQEWAQARGRKLPAYTIAGRDGPDHAPRFRVSVHVTHEQAVEASGATKQEAEKNAALAMLAQVGA